jgi:predicted flavoprotein YhiN
LQFVAGALSGIPVFQLSRSAAYLLSEGKKVVVDVDFFPEISIAEYEDFCRKRLDGVNKCISPGKSLTDFLLGMAHKKINQALIRKNGLNYDDKVADISWEKLWLLLLEFKGLKFHVKAVDSFENAQICAGGVSLCGLNECLESLTLPGLFFAGEILDVDGRCGGYNLQWAWSSGYISGANAASCGQFQEVNQEGDIKQA